MRGDADGGHGGDAKATGGDAESSNQADVAQENWGGGGHGSGPHGDKPEWGDCDPCGGKHRGKHEADSQENVSRVEQGDPEAKGGKAKAEGGDGGDADTGNVQFGNGNALAFALGGPAKAEGGDTCAESGDAYGGHGGDAKATGGDAAAWNYARAFQLNAPWKGGEL